MPNIKLMESGLPVAPLTLYNSGKAQWTRTQIHHYIIITCVTII